MDNYKEAFFALLRAGLWEQKVRLSAFDSIDFERVYKLAQEQTVVGLVAAGLEHVVDVKMPQKSLLAFAGYALQIEQKNRLMNAFIAEMMTQLQDAGINDLLVKGQGVAQCYERPLWRMCGDIDLLLDEDNYEKAKQLLLPLADKVETELEMRKHQGLVIKGWLVELHGSLRGGVLRRIDRGIDAIQSDVFLNKRFRVWHNGTTDVLLPAPTEDVLFVFAHLIQHFYGLGIGIRQICDWCRLIWVYREEINVNILDSYLRRMHLVTEWKVFAAFVVEFLGIPDESMPLYSADRRWCRKAERLLVCIMKTGNMGRDRDLDYYNRHSYVVSKLISLWRHTTDCAQHFFIFPLDSIIVWWRQLTDGIKNVV